MNNLPCFRNVTFRNYFRFPIAVVVLTLGHQAALSQTGTRIDDDRTMSIPKPGAAAEAASGSAAGGRVLPCCKGEVQVTNQAALEQYRKFAATIKPPLTSRNPAEDAELRRVLKSREWFKLFSRVRCSFGAGPEDFIMLTQEALIKRASGLILNTDATALYGDTTLIHYERIINYYPGLTPAPVKQERSASKSKFAATRDSSVPERFIAFRVTPLSREGYFRLEIGDIGGVFGKDNEFDIHSTMVGKMTQDGMELADRYRGYTVCKPEGSGPSK